MTRRSRTAGNRGVFAVMCALALPACHDGGEHPTAPSAPPAIDLSRSDTPLAFSTERYFLQLIGNDLSDDPTLPPCRPIAWPPGGKFVTSFLWFEREGDEVVGRSRPPYAATLEIRLRRVSSSILGVAVEGTVRGSAPDEYDRVWGKRDTTFNVEGGEVTLTGLVTPKLFADSPGPALGGWMRGPIGFRDSAGRISFCTNANYYLEPAAPGGVHDDPTVPPYVPGLLNRHGLELRPR